MNNPIYSDPEWMHKFLHNAAIYFESRPTNGEDTAYWANVYNAEKCIKIADEITRLSARVTELEEALGTLEKGASYTAKLGAVTGAHWLGLGTALIMARAVLKGDKNVHHGSN